MKGGGIKTTWVAHLYNIEYLCVFSGREFFQIAAVVFVVAAKPQTPTVDLGFVDCFVMSWLLLNVVACLIKSDKLTP